MQDQHLPTISSCPSNHQSFLLFFGGTPKLLTYVVLFFLYKIWCYIHSVDTWYKTKCYIWIINAWYICVTFGTTPNSVGQRLYCSPRAGLHASFYEISASHDSTGQKPDPDAARGSPTVCASRTLTRCSCPLWVHVHPMASVSGLWIRMKLN